MAHNYLEQLVAEWFEYRGYFVRRNILVGRRPNGGYECELDIVALHPSNMHLVHIEPSMDANSWAQREVRYIKKFHAGLRYIPALFDGFELPSRIEQIALLGFASKQNHQKLGGGNIVLVSELLIQIFNEIKGLPIPSKAISEDKPILRSFQFVSEYRNDILNVLFPKNPA